MKAVIKVGLEQKQKYIKETQAEKAQGSGGSTKKCAFISMKALRFHSIQFFFSRSFFFIAIFHFFTIYVLIMKIQCVFERDSACVKK